jgi:hypothetical protein
LHKHESAGTVKELGKSFVGMEEVSISLLIARVISWVPHLEFRKCSQLLGSE